MDYRCNLIIDSCCDLPSDIVCREGVELIRFPYFFNQEEFHDDLWQSEDPSSFYDRMRNGEQPTTAQVPIPVLEDAFGRAIASGVPTVYLSFSSALSGSYDAAILVRDRLLAENPGAELYVVDTHLASSGEGLLVFEALRQQERGLSALELAEWAEEAQYFVNIYFMVEDLESLRRGGRIPSSVAFAGSKLDVKPLLYVAADGSLSVKGIARGRKKGLKQLASLYEERADRAAESYAVTGTADCPEDVQKLEEYIANTGCEPLLVEGSIGPVVGCHVGPGMVALAFWGQDRRTDVSVADRIARKVKGGE